MALLLPIELYPAGVPGIAVRWITLRTGMRVRIAESGPPAGTPVVMLHGWGASLYMFRHAMTLLPPFGVRVVAVDLRGFGLSDKPRPSHAYTLEAYCADLDALFDALSLSCAVLMGHSMGGGVALHYALDRPDRVAQLILVSPVGLTKIPYLSLARLLPPPFARMFGARMIPRWMVRLILRRLAYGDAARVTGRDVDEYWSPTRLDGFMEAARATLSHFDWRPLSDAECADLAVPTVVFLGKEDRLVVNASAAAERLRNARVYTLTGGHCPHEVHPDEVYGTVGELVR